ncbi:glutathione S-transferase 1-1, partial [Harpegnathos saltator]|uniref:glutathione S-transferase 1-1 n=1 Tax=Harpegnathos saltator TaxID=610380 RepID=UPI000DBEE1F1
MSVQLYYYPVSPPCRAVLLTAEAVGLEVELIEMNLMAGEVTPEFQELNPQKTIPFMVDDDIKLSESRAIMTYLVDQYGENDSLYPQNMEARALVNQQLYFDLCTLYASIMDYYMPVFRKLTDTYDPAKFEKMTDAFQILNTILEGQDYVAGPNLTVADFSLIASVTTAEVFGFEMEEYKNVSDWLERIKESAPGYQKVNGDAVEAFKQFLESSLEKTNEEEEKEEGEEEKEEEEGENEDAGEEEKEEEEGEKEEAGEEE